MFNLHTLFGHEMIYILSKNGIYEKMINFCVIFVNPYIKKKMVKVFIWHDYYRKDEWRI
jgi:hypothetical protein